MSNLVTRYFVLHLDTKDFKPFAYAEYEVQLLDSTGRAIVSGYLAGDDASLTVEGHTVPTAVIEAAKRQVKGKGEYVNESGKCIDPF